MTGDAWVWGTSLALSRRVQPPKGEIDMKKLMTMTRQFRDDENGAAMVEYTVLLGIITVAVIATVVLVGTWVSGRWTALNSALTTATA
ncbi:pilin subunit [Mesorhizobium japonicum MAFF 303099]|uniref:Pilin subunit n=2 Tax=Mesorhizobium japonicum TaxID=2066070 RepID=Q989C8_RHILO|nr:pilin subunit [Mesorhizobium japonicum MAFF 303099]